MGEHSRDIEGDKPFTAYFATTLENFHTCACVVGGQVYFDKSREPRHVEPRATQYLHGLNGGAHIAVLRAKELNHTPAILQGQLDRKFSTKQELPRDAMLPVEYVYVPRGGSNWDDLSLVRDNEAFVRVYEKRRALDILRSY